MKHQRMPRKWLDKLIEARLIGTMETAGFGHGKVVYNGQEYDVTEFIVEQTRIYRETWLLPPLSGIIKWAEGGRVGPDDF